MRIQSIVMTNDVVQLTYLEEAGVNTDTGIVEARVLEIPHAVLPQALIDDLVDSAHSIIDEARVRNRQPADSFRAPR